ncbi:urease accessory protein UreF [Pollutimonas thiosulfatoxidans]|uniref:Urease accessory protein UreF n=1 Tax=Pollutimonas thiosulfatoxidans TaxID=2028345 RepID=A0A410G9M7_9BURK|nr:urease accessory UreF family protein [Pollutimonas thiosulfatoxidans]NYT45074.1 urease accessory protein UreF [Alcaligenaceae bacterium]QAA93019.1 urease accessory protein UreF [Pollutimonas thiosulfatoxidans]
MQDSQIVALLQLSSPALPIGGYSYSQGLEAAIDTQLITDEASAHRWIAQQLEWVLTPCEAPVWLLLFDSWNTCNWERLAHWNAWFLASRETRELRQETEQMAWSLVKLADELAWGSAEARDRLLGLQAVVLPTAHAYACWALGIPRRAGLAAYLFSWLENQTMAALKTVPLGQVAGQRILDQLRLCIPQACTDASRRAASDPPCLHTLAPQLAILSSRHETQYSRLFRS